MLQKLNCSDQADAETERQMKRIGGDLKADGIKSAIVVSRFNSFITEKLLEGAMDVLVRHGANEGDQTVVDVPGAFEIGPVAKRLAASGKYDAVICLGCVIRGGTDHYQFVASEAVKGVAAAAMEHVEVPVVLGVLTVDSIEQAIERAGTKMGNKGGEAAVSAIEMVNLHKALGKGGGKKK